MTTGAELSRLIRERARQVSEVREQLAALLADDEVGALPLAAIVGQVEAAVDRVEETDRSLAAACQHLAVEHQKAVLQARRYRDLFEFAPDGYLVTDLHGIIQEANQAAQRLLNVQPEYLGGVSLASLLAPGDDRRLSDLMSRLRLQAVPDSVVGWEMVLQPRNRPPVNVAVTLAVRRAEDERPIGLSWQLRDLTEIKRSERLAAIGQMMTGLAHESRNALQRGQACLEMLALELADRPRALDLLHRLQASQDHLHRLYEEIRHFAAPLRLEKTRCRLSALWRDAWDRLEGQRRGRQASLRDAVAGDDHCRVDPFRMTQVFRNLLENALAACPDPVEIDIGSTVKGDQLRVSVRDNGPGLPVGQEEKAFEPFFTTKLHGTGLGLALSRRIVEEHGGRLVPSTTRGAGAEILLMLPREEP